MVQQSKADPRVCRGRSRRSKAEGKSERKLDMGTTQEGVNEQGEVPPWGLQAPSQSGNNYPPLTLHSETLWNSDSCDEEEILSLWGLGETEPIQRTGIQDSFILLSSNTGWKSFLTCQINSAWSLGWRERQKSNTISWFLVWANKWMVELPFQNGREIDRINRPKEEVFTPVPRE